MNKFLKAAIEEARAGLATGGIPIGSILVIENEIVGRGHNLRFKMGAPCWMPRSLVATRNTG
jgi:cytosine/creatinine deaminase